MRHKVLVMLVLWLPQAVMGQSADASAIGVLDLSVEELLNTQVTSVSRKAQRLARAPAAVYVISQEDLRRSGATTIMEALRIVPGLQVAQITGSAWAISARGQNSRFSNKMLVLMDGRSIYNMFFSGVIWEYQDTLIEDIDRIEVIRGPGAVMWGANAMNGVINIITKSARQTQGILATAAAGTEDKFVGGIRVGVQLGERSFLRTYAKYGLREVIHEDSQVYRQNMIAMGSTPYYSAVGSLDHLHWSGRRGGFRWDWESRRGDVVTVEGDLSATPLQTTFNIPLNRAPYNQLVSGTDHPTAGNLVGRWSRTSVKGVESSLQFFYDRLQSSGPQWNYSRDTLDIDFQQMRMASDHNEFYWGLNARISADAVKENYTVRFEPMSRTDPLYAVVLRDEWQLTPNRWLLSVGSRFEHNNYTGFEVQPSVRLLYTPSRRQSAWAAWSRAVRTPSRVESGIDMEPSGAELGSGPTILRLVGSTNIQAEVLQAYELGWRQQSGVKWSVDATLFHHRYTHLFGYQNMAPVILSLMPPLLRLDLVSANMSDARSTGTEIWGTWKVHPRVQILPSYTFLFERSFEHRYDSPLIVPMSGHSPAHQWKLRTWWDVTPRFQVDGALYYVSPMPAHQIKGNTRFDGRVTYRPSRRHEFSFSLFDAAPRHLEYPPEGPFLATDQRLSLLWKWVGRF